MATTLLEGGRDRALRRDQRDATLIGRLRDKPPPAFIVGKASSQTLGFIRSLGRRGIPTLTLSRDPRPWAWSRYCTSHDTTETEPALVARLVDLGRRLPHRGVAVATDDAAVLLLSRHRDAVRQHVHLVLPPGVTVERLADKRAQCQHAARVGVPTPRTYYPECPGDLQSFAEVVRFPCLVKPARSDLWRRERQYLDGWRWTKVIPVATPEELRRACGRLWARGLDLLVQDRIEGGESRLYSVYLYLDRRSDPLAACVIQKRRQWPPGYGSGSYSVSCREDRVVELALRLLRPLGYQGVANLEFKLDSEDGEFKLVEVNTRCGERIELARAAGVDIPYIAYRDALGESTSPVLASEAGVTWINTLNDFAAMLTHYRPIERLSWFRWVSSVLAARSHAYFARDDPMPFLGNLARTARQEALPFLRMMRSGAGAAKADAAGKGRSAARAESAVRGW